MTARFKFKVFMFIAAASLMSASLYYLANMDKIQHLIKQTASNSSVMTDKKQVYYKWQDAQGQWHMSDKAPEQILAERVEVDTNVNIIRSVEVPQALKPTKTKPAEASSDKEFALPLLSPTQAINSLEEAKHAKALLEQRQQQMETMF